MASTIFFVGEKKYDIPEGVVQQFKLDNPDAQPGLRYKVGEADYLIPQSVQEAFLNDNPDAQQIFTPKEENTQKEDIIRNEVTRLEREELIATKRDVLGQAGMLPEQMTEPATEETLAEHPPIYLDPTLNQLYAEKKRAVTTELPQYEIKRADEDVLKEHIRGRIQSGEAKTYDLGTQSPDISVALSDPYAQWENINFEEIQPGDAIKIGNAYHTVKDFNEIEELQQTAKMHTYAKELKKDPLLMNIPVLGETPIKATIDKVAYQTASLFTIGASKRWMEKP